MPKQTQYTSSEIRLLWYLKRHGGSVSISKGTRGNNISSQSLYTRIEEDTGLTVHTIRGAAKGLETKCVVIRHYTSERKRAWGGGGARLVKLEMVDPNMFLPAEPKQPTLGVVLAKENDELYERTAHEPDPIAMLEAVITENDKLHEQVDKLQNIIEQLVKELEDVKHTAKRTAPEHLTQRVRNIVPKDVWDQLSH